MADPESSSQLFSTGNERVYLKGDRNICKFSHSKDCNVFSNQSRIVIESSSLVTVKTRESSISLTNGTNANIAGDSNIIHAENFGDVLLDGSNNLIQCCNTKDLIWSGSNGKCGLIENLNLRVYGKENQIAGKSNTNLIICGHDNMLVANETENLQLNGHMNQVMATRTKNLSIDGHENRASVSDVGIRHLLTKALPPDIPENQIDICGILADCSVYEEMLCPPKQLFDLATNADGPYNSPKCVQNPMESDKTFTNTNNNCPQIMPQVQIRYVDQAYINNYTYKLGIFHITLEGLLNFHYSHLPVKVKVMVDELDRGSYKYQLAPCGKILMLSGSKHDAKQTLKLTGNRITENLDHSFSVFIESFEVDEREKDNDASSSYSSMEEE